MRARRSAASSRPASTSTERENETRVTAELPGVREEDIDVTVDGDILTIRAEKRIESSEGKEARHVSERAYGTFQRSLRLPQPIDPDQVRAHFAQGVLTICLPRTQPDRDRRCIAIQSGPPETGTTPESEVRH